MSDGMPVSSRLAPRYLRIRPPVFDELRRSARERIAAGEPVLDMITGRLPGEVPRHLRQMAMDSWRDGHHTYLEGAGLPALREHVVDWLDVRGQRTAEDVLVSPGSRAALLAVLQVVAGPGDVVLVDGVSMPILQPIVAAAGATPVPAHASGSRLLLCPEDVRHHLDSLPGVRALVLSNPVDPTGQLYDADTLCGIVEVCATHRVVCVVDRAFGRVVFDGRTFPYLSASPGLRDWCVLVDGVARAVRGLDGLRVGWACGPRDVIEAATLAQEHGAGPPGRVAQRVALEALQSPWDIGVRDELEAARDWAEEAFAGIPGVEVWPVQGTFYGILDLAAHLGRANAVGWVCETGADLADHLLAQAGLLVLPVDALTRRGLVRFTFGVPHDHIGEAAQRLAFGLEALRA